MVAALPNEGGKEKRYTLQNIRYPCNERPQWLTARLIAHKCAYSRIIGKDTVLAVASGVRHKLSHISYHIRELSMPTCKPPPPFVTSFVGL
jgi:hypothetical protein